MATTITVEGMTCGGCEQNVEEALADVDGVTSVDVDRTTDSATIEGNSDTDALVSAIEDAGYSTSA